MRVEARQRRWAGMVVGVAGALALGGIVSRPRVMGETITIDSVARGGSAAPAPRGDDFVIADFEGRDYGGWNATGDAFGAGPAQGTLPGQMPVSGYEGKGLVNSFLGGDGSTGTLTSPEFTIERAYIGFLVGGGQDRERTCINLLIGGRIVRSATGPNDRPGGSEALAPEAWDVREFVGQTAAIQIVDAATGGWGHINVDQIVQTDSKPAGLLVTVVREVTISARYLNLPVKNGGPKRQMSVAIEGEPTRSFEIELADGAADWWAFMDVGPFEGRRATLTVERLPDNSAALLAVDQTDEIKGADSLYRESLRPQFHFSARRGWNNDPNGLVYFRGEYHLFFQHNPYGWGWGNMHWGHAVSPDLIHWTELPVALRPDALGTIYSGSAVVDWHNTAGFQTGDNPALVCMYTAAGDPFTQCIAFSNDRGRTWTKYAGNPVLPHIVGGNRDPKVLWYAPQEQWVMALYLDGNEFGLFSSKDLKRWERMSTVTIPGTSECPELFEIALDGDARDTRWVVYGGNGGYLVGAFDGRTFTPESGPHLMQHGNCWYASQTFSDIPAADGRRILIPWGTMATPGMPFNQMMGLPVELTLRTTEDGPRLLAMPVEEHASLRVRSHTLPTKPLEPGENPLAGLQAELVEVVAELSVGDAAEIGFRLRGIEVAFDVAKRELRCLDRSAPLRVVDGKIRLRVLVDRTSIDIFGNDGRLYMPMGVIVPRDERSLEVYAKGRGARVESLEVHELRSSWGE